MYIDLLILMQIEQSPKHGYEIKKNIQNDLGHLLVINHNMLYPALRRFTEEGAVRKRVHEQEGKPNQVIYDITDSGRRRIIDLINEFTEKDAKHEIEFLVRVSLFHRISKENRLRILEMRKKDLETRLADIDQRQNRHDEKNVFLSEVFQFSGSRARKELMWIHELISKIEHT